MNNFKSYVIVLFQSIIVDFKNNPTLLLFVLVLTTIPLSNFINSSLLGLFFIVTLFFLKKSDFLINKALILLMLFYILMLISYSWSIDKYLTIKALPKEISLLTISLIFIFAHDFLIFNKNKIIKYYSYSIVFFTLFYFFKAIYNYLITHNFNVFFHHDLVSKELNAIHVSVFVSIAFFYFLTKELKKKTDYFLTVYLFAFLLLLSSKIIIVTTILLTIIYFFFYSKSANKMRLKNIALLGIVLLCVFSFTQIKERLLFEFKIKAESNIGHTVINQKQVGSNIISMKEAWYNEKFNQTDYFSGSSFRVYQARLFFEFLQEENIFWTGFGLNASYKKLEEKGTYYNVFQGNNHTEGYQKKNFHNQYIQVFAELGVFGFIILLLILYANLKNGIKHKNFIHIAFAVLMISLFLTESFLWRQRGVVFFTLFYCLFNSSSKQIIKNQ